MSFMIFFKTTKPKTDLNCVCVCVCVCVFYRFIKDLWSGVQKLHDYKYEGNTEQK